MLRFMAITCMIGNTLVLEKCSSSIARKFGNSRTMSGLPARKQSGGRAISAQSISPAASIWLKDLSATRVSCTPGGRPPLDLLDAARLIGAGLVPMHVGELDAGLVVQPAAHVDGGGVRPFGGADRAALEIGGGLDAGLAVHIERTEPEQA